MVQIDVQPNNDPNIAYTWHIIAAIHDGKGKFEINMKYVLGNFQLTSM